MTPRNALVLLRGVTWTAVASITGCAVVIGGGGGALGPASTGSVALAASYALLAAAAAFTLDEPAAPVVDVTQTGRVRRTAIRGYALSVPLIAGAFLVAAVHARDGSQSAPDLVVAAVGNVLLGFAVACAARRRSDEPGMWAATAITVLLVIPPGLGPSAMDPDLSQPVTHREPFVEHLVVTGHRRQPHLDPSQHSQMATLQPTQMVPHAVPPRGYSGPKSGKSPHDYQRDDSHAVTRRSTYAVATSPCRTSRDRGRAVDRGSWIPPG